MKVGIMQPYFFPYLGYFHLINSVDRFIIGDDVQHISKGWINRNRILKPGADGWGYIIVPLVKHQFQILIKDVHIAQNDDWGVKMLRQIEQYKKRSPYYNEVFKLISESFAYKDKTITQLNARCLKATCDYIGIDFKVEIQSEMDFDYSNVHDREERPIRMCQQLGATEYINPLGGTELYTKERFAENGLKLSFIKPALREYNQFRNSFEPGLSVIDVMMFNSPEEISAMLNEYELV
jgi:hypothetical protein